MSAKKERKSINLVGGSSTVTSKPKKRKKVGKKSKSRGRTTDSRVAARGRGRSSRE